MKKLFSTRPMMKGINRSNFIGHGVEFWEYLEFSKLIEKF